MTLRLVAFSFLLLAAFSTPRHFIVAAPFKHTIYAANTAFNKQDFSQATELFIKGYWELRNTLTTIWYQADPVGKSKSIAFNGEYVPIELGRFSNPRVYMTGSNMWLGCWLNNSLLRQKVNWYHPTSKGLLGSVVYYKGKSKSNVIKKNSLQPLNQTMYAA